LNELRTSTLSWVLAHFSKVARRLQTFLSTPSLDLPLSFHRQELSLMHTAESDYLLPPLCLLRPMSGWWKHLGPRWLMLESTWMGDQVALSLCAVNLADGVRRVGTCVPRLSSLTQLALVLDDPELHLS
jgi:hypothetical protein